MSNIAKNGSLCLQKHNQYSQKTVFRGGVPPDLPPSGGLTLNFFQHDKILSMYYCKKLEVYFQKHGQNSQKTFLTGEPPDLSPSGGLTAAGFPYDEILSK